MTKYKAGDKVTIVLDQYDADIFNDDAASDSKVREYNIIKHEPAPEPIVGWMNVYPSGFGQAYAERCTADVCAGEKRLALLRIEYNPATKQAKAEVVE